MPESQASEYMFGVGGGWKEGKRSIESKGKLHFGEHVFPNVKHDTLILLHTHI